MTEEKSMDYSWLQEFFHTIWAYLCFARIVI